MGVPLAPKPEEQFPIKGVLPHVVKRLWNMDFSPMSIVRSMGPWGPNLIKGYTTRRFAHMDPIEVEAIEDYIYHINAQPGSGEYALTRLLLPVSILLMLNMN